MDKALAERDFLAASVAAWREVDRIAGTPGKTLRSDTLIELRKREHSAWLRYREALDEEEGRCGLCHRPATREHPLEVVSAGLKCHLICPSPT